MGADHVPMGASLAAVVCVPTPYPPSNSPPYVPDSSYVQEKQLDVYHQQLLRNDLYRKPMLVDYQNRAEYYQQE
jgi:hypothetical protein